jgi:translation elongation factor P/translation initiation factor 5A
MVVSTAEFKKGMKIQFDGQPYTIVDALRHCERRRHLAVR